MRVKDGTFAPGIDDGRAGRGELSEWEAETSCR